MGPELPEMILGCPGTLPGKGHWLAPMLWQFVWSFFFNCCELAFHILSPVPTISQYTVVYLVYYPCHNFGQFYSSRRYGERWAFLNMVRQHYRMFAEPARMSVMRLCREEFWAVSSHAPCLSSELPAIWEDCQHFLNLCVKGNGLLDPEPSDWSVCWVLCNLPFCSSLIMSVMRFIMLV